MVSKKKNLGDSPLCISLFPFFLKNACKFANSSQTITLKSYLFVDTETCTFDSPTEDCHWKNLLSGDEIDWIRQAGSTPSSQTGPSNDHTLKNGNLFNVTFVRYM